MVFGMFGMFGMFGVIRGVIGVCARSYEPRVKPSTQPGEKTP
jgi:hypothetical protein